MGSPLSSAYAISPGGMGRPRNEGSVAGWEEGSLICGSLETLTLGLGQLLALEGWG